MRGIGNLESGRDRDGVRERERKADSKSRGEVLKNKDTRDMSSLTTRRL